MCIRDRSKNACQFTACDLLIGGRLTCAVQNTLSNSCVFCLPEKGETVTPTVLDKVNSLFVKFGELGISIILATH